MGPFKKKWLSKLPKGEPPNRASGDGYLPGPQRHETGRSGLSSESPSPSSTDGTVSHDCPIAIPTPDGQPRAQQQPSFRSSQAPPDPTQQLFGGSLWEDAANSLDADGREKLNSLKSEQREIQAAGSLLTHRADPTDVIDIVLRKVLAEITKAALAVKGLGDAAVKFDASGYAALGWSVVSFGLQVTANTEDARKFALESSEFVGELTTRYAKYESLLRGAQPDKEFDNRMVEVYGAILRFVIELDKYLEQDKLIEKRSISKTRVDIGSKDDKVKAWLPIAIFNSNKYDFVELLKASKAQILLPASQECLNSLAFLEMDSRFHRIGAATRGTCKWLGLHKKYSEWVECDRGLLWINGKPGSGKSVLLRSALDNVMAVSKIDLDAIVLSFFFDGRGVKLQKTLLGLFRSLLYQLLHKLPDKLTGLIDAFNKKNNSVKPGEKWDWEPDELRDLFELSLTKALENQPVWLFIDALDESGSLTAVNLVEQLNRIRFKSCFEDNNGADISNYVRNRLSTCDEQVAATIPALITTRARGVFMWARLVVDKVLLLNRETAGFAKIEREVYSIHPDLDQLYYELIQGMNERPASLKLVQWLCFATRPLTLDELRWAMVTDPDCSYKTLKEYQTVDDYVSDADMMERRLKALSCGLAETVPLSDTKVVQFIHQSVKDFFVDQGLSALDKSNKWAIQFIRQLAWDILKSVWRTFVEKGLSSPDGSPNTYLSPALIALATVLMYLDYFTRGPRSLLPDYAFPLPAIVAVISVLWLYDEVVRNTRSDFAIGIAHYRLSRTCIRYLEMEEIGQSTSLDRKDLKSKFPLLHYATTSWVVHAQQSQVKGISQGDLLNYFGGSSNALLELWVKIYPQIDGWSHHCPPKGASMVHVASRYQLIEPLQAILRKSGQAKIGIYAKDHSDQTPLFGAAENGHEAAVRLLLDRGATIDAKDLNGQTPLFGAAEDGYEAVVRLLLDRGAVINGKDFEGRTPLFWAAKKGHEAVVRLLLDRGATY
ncbi:hypothetical protein BJ170DRAFT_737129 [Xylariales sp. AK1849]|nr:hypothetical protein BJ170DRAFT_737129 [Xylariales sp. AK1849]